MASPNVEVTRTFNAPKDLVFRTWLEPEKLKQWWGPEEYTCPHFSNEPKVGGKYLASMKAKSGGEEMWGTGIYKEIKPGEKLVMTDSFSDEKGQVISADKAGMPGKWPLECLITVTFAEAGPKTTMKLVHEGIPPEMREDCTQGWGSSFNKMEELFKN